MYHLNDKIFGKSASFYVKKIVPYAVLTMVCVYICVKLRNYYLTYAPIILGILAIINAIVQIRAEVRLYKVNNYKRHLSKLNDSALKVYLENANDNKEKNLISDELNKRAIQ